jgi:hypothetical protein
MGLAEALASFRSEVDAVRHGSALHDGPILSQGAASKVMHELDGLCRSAADDKADQGGSYGLSPGEMKMLVEYNDRATELLRHFWRCYPLSSRALATKVRSASTSSRLAYPFTRVSCSCADAHRRPRLV